MSFYLRASTGYISLQRLEMIAIKRLIFLLKVHKTGANQVQLLDIVKREDSVQNSDCLIGGSQKDNVSHFILRLLLGTDLETRQFFLEAETLLFSFRFSCMTESEIYLLLKSVKNETRKIHHFEKNNFDEFNTKHLISVLLSIRHHSSSWRTVASKYIHGCHDHFLLPFQVVTTLVSRREVTLNGGMARVPCLKLGEVFTGVFRRLLSVSVHEVGDLSTILNDERIKNLALLLKATFRKNNMGLGSAPVARLLRVQDIDKVLHLFPPCMMNLHHVLSDCHRLRHHDRIQYTLFLKEAGMSLHQALLFWGEEYSKETQSEHGCRHSWQKDEKRYVYNIRHLYGLEGSRRNYRSHCCASLQTRQLIGGEVGGCPFVHFDDWHLRSFMSANHIPESNQKEILKVKSQGRASACCKMYYNCAVNSSNTRTYEDESDLMKNPTNLSHMYNCETKANHNVHNTTAVKDVSQSLIKSKCQLNFCSSSPVVKDVSQSMIKSKEQLSVCSCQLVVNHSHSTVVKDVSQSLTKSKCQLKICSSEAVKYSSSTVVKDVSQSMTKSKDQSNVCSSEDVPNHNRLSSTTVKDVSQSLIKSRNQSSLCSCQSVLNRKRLNSTDVKDVSQSKIKSRNQTNVCCYQSMMNLNRSSDNFDKYHNNTSKGCLVDKEKSLQKIDVHIHQYQDGQSQCNECGFHLPHSYVLDHNCKNKNKKCLVDKAQRIETSAASVKTMYTCTSQCQDGHSKCKESALQDVDAIVFDEDRKILKSSSMPDDDMKCNDSVSQTANSHRSHEAGDDSRNVSTLLEAYPSIPDDDMKCNDSVVQTAHSCTSESDHGIQCNDSVIHSKTFGEFVHDMECNHSVTHPNKCDESGEDSCNVSTILEAYPSIHSTSSKSDESCDDMKCSNIVIHSTCSKSGDHSCNESTILEAVPSIHGNEMNSSDSVIQTAYPRESHESGVSSCNVSTLLEAVPDDMKCSNIVIHSTTSNKSGDDRCNVSTLLEAVPSIPPDDMKCSNSVIHPSMSDASRDGCCKMSKLLEAYQSIPNDDTKCNNSSTSHESGDNGWNVSTLLEAYPSIPHDTSIPHDDTKCNNSVTHLSTSDASCAGCFDHDLCPSQTASNLQRKSTEKLEVCTESLAIYKPLDYYTSFHTLMHGLAGHNVL